ncbi:MAG: FixH family protein [Thermoflavifilum sp.]|nr:FixH family protein [Thermoflavifilum sp.]MCL6513029.1 copper resistance CopC/CopD family protein [Alicyclobacillus sp.]
MRTGARIGRMAVAATVILWLSTVIAWAHAYVVKSSPAPGQVLRSAPSEVQVWFDEPIASPLDTLTVAGSSGQRVDQGNAHVDPADPRLLEVSLRPNLPDGLYTATWHVISADGHPVSGVIPFQVGQAPAGMVHANPVLQSYVPGPVAILQRTALYVGTLGLFGYLVLTAWVLPAPVREQWHGREGRVIWLLWALLLVAVLTSLPLQVHVDLGVPWTAALNPAQMRVLLGTTFGVLWFVQLLLTAVLANVFGWRRMLPKTTAHVLALLLIAGVVVTKALTAHAAATDVPVLAVTLDVLHMLAAGTWVGGLLALVHVVWRLLRGADDEAGNQVWEVLRRFTPVGLAAVGVIGVTGVFAALLQIPTVYALTHTTYGRTLLVKLALFAVMLGFALYHALRAQLAAAPGQAAELEQGRSPRGIRGTLVAEWLVGIAVFIVTALLTNLPPAQANPGPVHVARSLGQDEFTLSITPNIAGSNHFTVQVEDANGRPVTDLQQVTLTMRSLDMDMGTVTVRLPQVSPGVYEATGLYLTMAGRWDVQLQALTADFQQLNADVEIHVGEPGA